MRSLEAGTTCTAHVEDYARKVMVEGKGFGRRGSPSSGTSVLSPAQNRVARCIPRHPGPSLGELRTPLRPIQAYALGAGHAEHPELLVNGVLEAILFARRGESRMSDRERVGPNRSRNPFLRRPPVRAATRRGAAAEQDPADPIHPCPRGQDRPVTWRAARPGAGALYRTLGITRRRTRIDGS